MQSKEVQLNYFVNEINELFTKFYNEPTRPFRTIEENGKYNFADFEDEKMQYMYVMPEYLAIDSFIVYVRVVHGLIGMINLNAEIVRNQGVKNEQS